MIDDKTRITKLEESRKSMERRLDTVEENHSKLEEELREFARTNEVCHGSIGRTLMKVNTTLAVIDTKIGAISRVFWILVAAIVTSSVGVVIAMIIKFGGNG